MKRKKALLILLILSSLPLCGADTKPAEGHHPLSVSFALDPEPVDGASTSAEASPITTRFGIPFNEYENLIDVGFSELPHTIHPNQINTINRDYAFRRTPTAAPLLLAHDREGRLYLRQILLQGTIAICHAVNHSGAIDPIIQYRDQAASNEQLWDIKNYEAFYIATILLIEIKNQLRAKATCFVSIGDDRYRIAPLYPLAKRGKKQSIKQQPNYLFAVNTDTAEVLPLAHLLLGQWDGFAAKLKSGFINFYTTNCVGWKKSINKKLLRKIDACLIAHKEAKKA